MTFTTAIPVSTPNIVLVRPEVMIVAPASGARAWAIRFGAARRPIVLSDYSERLVRLGAQDENVERPRVRR